MTFRRRALEDSPAWEPSDRPTRRRSRRLELGPHRAPHRRPRQPHQALPRTDLLAIVSLLAATATALAPPLLAKLAIDEGIGNRDVEILGWIVAAFLFAGLLNWLASMAQTYYTGWVGERILADLRKRLFAHLQRLSLGYYERNRAGTIISRLTNDVEALDQLVTDGVTSLFQNSLTLFGSVIILFFLDWRLALATLSVFPLMSIATAIFRRRSSRAYRRVRERLAGVTATLAESIAGMRVVQAFTREDHHAAHFRAVNEDYRAANRETVVLNGLYFPFVDFLSAAATSIVLGYGGYLAFDGSIEIGTLFAFIGYLSNFFDPVQQLSQLYNTFLAAVAALDKIIDVLDEEPEIVDRPGRHRPARRSTGHVRFEDVRFGYRHRPRSPPRNRAGRPGGHDGRARRPHGRGQVDDREAARAVLRPPGGPDHDRRSRPPRGHPGEHPRDSSASCPQEGFLFAGTVHENILFGRPDASPEEVAAAARAVGAHEFILELEDGYETEVAERGGRLSLGQRQLVAFARALLADPRILILDEATSSVDIGTERRIERALGHAPRRPHGVHHRPPPLDDPKRRPHRRPRARAGGRAGDARRAARPRRAVPLAVRGLGICCCMI